MPLAGGGAGSRACVLCLTSFFFQAEDGIRDLTVTGVQTCALPIFAACALTTTCWPRPLRPRARCASSVPTAASAPAWQNACQSGRRTGGRSSSPPGRERGGEGKGGGLGGRRVH